MIKILYIISDKNFGGGSRHVFDLITNLNKKKFIPILATAPSPIYNGLKNTIKCYQVKMKSIIDFKSVKDIQKIIKTEKPDIIHLHSTRAGILGTYAAKDCQIPIIYTEHLFAIGYIPKNKLIHKLQIAAFKKLAKNITKIVAVSQSVKLYLLKNKIFPKNKIEIIYNGINIKKTSSKKHRKKHHILIGTIGSLTEIKGYKYLLKALKIVNSSKIKNWRLEVIGSGPLEKNLKTLGKKYNILDRIDFLGQKTNVDNRIKNWDIYVQTSLSESFGLAAAETMAKGIPVIVTKVGGLKELVNNHTGILTEPKNANTLAFAIIKLIKSPKIRVEMGKNARQRIERYFSLKSMIDKTEKLYEKTIKLCS